MEKKKIVLSGIRATGNLHLGNYYGALSKFVRMQDDYDCRFFVADLHALTTHPDPKALHENVKQILAEYLAAGLDPEKNIIYVQSDVPEIAEMYLLMNMHVGIGELMRTASFKDKARKALGIQSDSDEIEKEIIGNQTNQRVNAGLLTYPTLMAVDILIRIHKSDHFLCTDAFRKRHHHQYASDFLIRTEICHKRAQLFFCHIIGGAEDLCINAIALGDLLHKRCVHGRRLGGSGQNDSELGFIVLLTQFCKAQGELFFQSSRSFFSV